MSCLEYAFEALRFMIQARKIYCGNHCGNFFLKIKYLIINQYFILILLCALSAPYLFKINNLNLSYK